MAMPHTAKVDMEHRIVVTLNKLPFILEP